MLCSHCDNMPRSPSVFIDHTSYVTLTSAGQQLNDTLTHSLNDTTHTDLSVKLNLKASSFMENNIQLQGYRSLVLADDCWSSGIDYPQVLI